MYSDPEAFAFHLARHDVKISRKKTNSPRVVLELKKTNCTKLKNHNEYKLLGCLCILSCCNPDNENRYFVVARRFNHPMGTKYRLVFVTYLMHNNFFLLLGPFVVWVGFFMLVCHWFHLFLCRNIAWISGMRNGKATTLKTSKNLFKVLKKKTQKKVCNRGKWNMNGDEKLGEFRWTFIELSKKNW